MKTPLLASAVLCTTFALSGCQSMENPPSTHTKTPAAVPTTTKPAMVDETEIASNQVIPWSSHYHWQLSEVKRGDGQPVTAKLTDTIRLEVAPKQLHFYQGCTHEVLTLRPSAAVSSFGYQGSLTEQPASCRAGSTVQAPSMHALLQPMTERPFRLELLTVNAALKANGDAPAAPKRLAIILSNGDQFIFTGTAKTLPATKGLPLNPELLERFDWHLVSAVANHYDEQGKRINREPISDFYHPKHPISFGFNGYMPKSLMTFDKNCNQILGYYFLMDNNILVLGHIIQTAMSCGETSNRIEGTLVNMMRNSSSMLTLSHQSQTENKEGNTARDYPRYNLLQTMATGETLVWQNTPRLDKTK